MDNTRILWVDDEVENLRPHIIFLESKGFHVLKATNGSDALSILGDNLVDVVLLDEHMPGQSGLDILPEIKILRPSVPIIMVTKSEEEGLMEQAIGEDIADYLLKPVQPRQILSSLMRLLDRKQLVSNRSISNYQSGFRELSESINYADSWIDWTTVYKELIKWDKRLSGSDAESMRPMLDHQKEEANRIFSRFWAENYPIWLNSVESPCEFSHQIFRNKVGPHIKSGKKSVVLIFDNLRLDQWMELQPFFNESFRIESDELYASILPTATQYARNSLISGLLPLDLFNNYPECWVTDVVDAAGGRNANESFFLGEWAKKERIENWSYVKVTNHSSEQKWVRQWTSKRNDDLVVVVVNFIDMISHAKTDQSIVRDIANSDSGFRALTHSWWKNSPLRLWIESLASDGFDLFVTTDHGTISAKKPIPIKGPKNINANMRYKIGRGMEFSTKDIGLSIDPKTIGLPSIMLGDKAVFASESGYFVYPNQYNQYAGKFEGSYQHGGISMEEIIIPFAQLTPR